MRIVEESEHELIRQQVIPKHVGCIMDGNGRWALTRDLGRSDGHRAAKDAILDVVDGCLELGVEWLTLYAFSTENWNRPRREVEFLMDFNEWLIHEDDVDEFIEKGVRLRFVGRIAPPYVGKVKDRKIPKDCYQHMLAREERSRGCTKLQLCIAFNYGGHLEIVDAVNAAVAAGATTVDEDSLRSYMYEPEMPDFDLVIRTSSEVRLSNFFPWHSSYAELVFSETLWPDFRKAHFYSALSEFQRRKRRKGETSADG